MVDRAMVPSVSRYLSLADVVLMRPPRVTRIGENPEWPFDGYAEGDPRRDGGTEAVVFITAPVRDRRSKRPLQPHHENQIARLVDDVQPPRGTLTPSGC